MEPDELSPGVKRLRRAVIVMGYMLVIGTIVLFISAYFKFAYKKDVVAPAAPAVVEQKKVTEKCTFKPESNIQIEGLIVSSNINNNVLTLTTYLESKKGTQQIVVFDMCSGEVLSRINVFNK